MDTNSFSAAGLPLGHRERLLDGVVVLDLTRFLAGPFAGMILADMGATVIKVEQLSGDTTRTQPPYFYGADSAYFMAVNRNKRSISLDIKSEAGRAIMRRLIAQADIILDNLRYPQRVTLGLDFESLKKINSQIISCSVTGFGSSGPYEDRPAYDIVVEALAGVMSLTGPSGGPSVRAGVPIGDLVAGLYAVVGSLAGLAHRQRTGMGEHVDISMLDSQIALLSYVAQYYLTGGLVATHQGRAHVSIPTYNTFATRDGSEIVIAANTQEMWESLCQVLDRTDLLIDPKYSDRKSRLQNRDALVPELEYEFSRRPWEDLLRRLIDHGVPAARINSIASALDDPQVRHREMVVKLTHRDGGEIATLGSPVQTEHGGGLAFFSPPGLGEHTREILHEVGFTAQEIEGFVVDGVVRVATETVAGV